jgi:hypothetical protein
VIASDLFMPLVDGSTGRADPRLLKAIGLPPEVPYSGEFGRVFNEDEGTRFDFCLEGPGGRKVFFVFKAADGAFGACPDDPADSARLERHYLPYLIDHVDVLWLAKATFLEHFEILRNVSYLGCYPESGLVFIYPKANEKLAEPENAIKRIVSKSLAPRVAILYLEYLVARLLTLTEDDAALHERFLQLKDKYVLPPP